MAPERASFAVARFVPLWSAMRLHRQVCVAAVLALSACEEDPFDAESPDCTWEGEMDGTAIELTEEGLTLRVCGDAQVWVQEGGDAVAISEFSVVAAPAAVLRTDDDRLVLGVTPDTPSLGLLVVPELLPGERTRNAYLDVNLDPSEIGTGPFDPLDPTSTSEYQTSFTLHSSDQEPVDVQLYFTNKGAGAWSMVPMAPGSTSDSQRALGTAELQFSVDGEFVSIRDGSFEDPVTAALSWEMHLESPPGGPSGFRATSVAGASSIEAFEQDGVASSRVTGVALTRRGEMVGFGDDGRTRTLGWVLDGLQGWLVPVGSPGARRAHG